jgi:hypothetical protein
MRVNLSHALGAFAGAVAVGAAALLIGAAQPGIPQVIDVQRINIREPDGTLRMVISGSARAPGIIVKGQETPHPTRHDAGMIFYNQEGTENGGLIFSGEKTSDGVAHSAGSLTFDRYEQDQVVQLVGSEDGSDRYAGMIVSDRPDQPLDFAAIDRIRSLTGAAQQAALKAANASGTRRAFVGRAADGASEVVLQDANGVKRLRLRVTADGEAAIQFLGKDGQVLRSIGARPD